MWSVRVDWGGRVNKTPGSLPFSFDLVIRHDLTAILAKSHVG